MLQCPHCFRRVLPSREGICPACQKNTNSREGVNPDIVLLKVGENSIHPHRCCSCAGPTKRKVRITRSLDLRNGGTTEDNSLLAPTVVKMLFLLLFGVITIPYGAIGRMLTSGNSNEHSGTITVKIIVNQCPFCYREKPVEPVRIDYDYCYMEVPVRAEYAEEYLESNPT